MAGAKYVYEAKMSLLGQGIYCLLVNKTGRMIWFGE